MGHKLIVEKSAETESEDPPIDPSIFESGQHP